METVYVMQCITVYQRGGNRILRHNRIFKHMNLLTNHVDEVVEL